MTTVNGPTIKSFGTFLRNIPQVEEQAKNFIVGAVSPRIIDEINLPTNFDGRNVWKHYLSPIKNQGHCGCCYSCSTVGALADRYSILTLNQVHIELSASDMVMCMTVDPNFTALHTSFDTKVTDEYRKAEVETREKFACNGNTLYNAGKYLYIEGAPAESCIPDSLITSAEGTKQVPFCEEIEGNEFDICLDKKTAQRYFRASKAYQLEYNKDDIEGTEKSLMYDLYKWGPFAAGFLIFDDFLNNYDGKSIYTTKGQGSATLGHAIRVVGWGAETQGGRLVKYWICANSWGKDWGDQGFFKVERFLQGINLEQNTMSLVPDLPGIPNLDTFSTTGYITQVDRNARRSLGVSLFNLYPYSAIDKIREGELQGDLADLIIKPRLLPNRYSSFIAGRINSYDFNEIARGFQGNKCTWTLSWIIFFIVISFIIGCIGMYLYIWKLKRRVV